jgi:hypothetical protein
VLLREFRKRFFFGTVSPSRKRRKSGTNGEAMVEQATQAKSTRFPFRVYLLFFALCWVFVSTANAQVAPTAELSGHVADSTGALIPGARVELHPVGGGADLSTTADSAGSYAFTGVDAGTYIVTTSAAGFARRRSEPVALSAGKIRTLDIHLTIADQVQQIDVAPDSGAETDPNHNGDSIVLKGKAIDDLPIEQGALSDELNALAGSTTPDLEINGFSGGTMPPRNSIREIRINQNPYSAKNDTNPINGMIEVFTKPGSDKFHGQFFINGDDSSFNALSPFVQQAPAYHSIFSFGNLSGPITKHASIFLDSQRSSNTNNSVVNAQILDANNNPTSFSQAVSSPSTFNEFSARLDTSIGKKSTLIVRYSLEQNDQTNAGIGNLSLASQGYNSTSTNQTLQISNSQVLNAKIVNDTRFQYIRSRVHQTPDSTDPSIAVQGAFNGGGNGSGSYRDNQDHYELQNYVSEAAGKHFFNYGGRLRVGRDANRSLGNYNGSFIFSTLAAYQITQQGLNAGLTPAQIRAAGGGASQFSITTGTPTAIVTLADLGLFFQDDWKTRPNLTLSFGLRFETQNHIADHADWAPRAGFAWGLGAAKGKPPRCTLRGASGIFYKRFASSNVLQLERQNGIAQQAYVINSPDFYPAIPTPSALGSQTPSATYQISPHFHSPYFISSTIGLTRQIGKLGTVTATYLVNRSVHGQLTRNINAPLPGTYDPADPTSGTRPLGGNQNIYEYESAGIYNTQRFTTNIFLRFKDKFFIYGLDQLRVDRSDNNGGFPSNQYDIGADYGRSSSDTRNVLTLGANGSLPFGINPGLFVTASSGAPFNIVVGQDLNGDSQFNDRPAFATDLTRPSVVRTRYGNFDTNPIAGQTIIPINYGQGPGTVTFNLSLRRGFEFGPVEKPPAGSPAPKPAPGAKPGAKPHVERKYALDLFIFSQNALNHVNLAAPIGTLNSPLFGKSVALANGSGSANRTVFLGTAFRF